ncbi:MAG: AAA family ATPase [Acidimicrobiia bacterium]
MTAPDGLTAFQASFDRRDVTRGWCESVPPNMKPSLEAIEELTDLALADRRVVAIIERAPAVMGSEQPLRADGTAASPVLGDRRWSTVEMLAVEERLLEYASISRGVGAGRVAGDVIDAVLDDRADLSPEQTAMVRTITTSGDGIDIVVGRAGTGKTYALAAAAQVWRAAGFRPIGIALAARAAAELETSAGITSTTVAQFLIDADHAPRGLIDERHVVVVDEAGMVDTRRLARVVRHVEAAGAKAVLVGDHHQLPAVEAGGAFAALVARLPFTELIENRRQVEHWERDALERVRTAAGGRPGVESVVATYGARGRLHLGATPAEVRSAMVDDWYAARQEGASVAMVALRCADVRELNQRARALLIADGSVEAEGITAEGCTFSVGDRIVCLYNDRRVGVHNAMFGRVTGVDADSRSLTVEPEGGGARVLVPWDYIASGHVAHGYATTIHKAQGATYDRTLLLGDDRLYRQAGYTGLSRGRQRNDMYLVVDDDREHDVELARHGQTPPDEPVERLVQALHRDGSKLLALDESGPGRTPPAPKDTLSALWHAHDRLAAHLSDPPADCSHERRKLDEIQGAIAHRGHLAARAAEIDRPRHIIDMIGEPPPGFHGREQWRDAAAAIELYEARWGTSLGADVDDRASTDQLDDLAHTRERVAAYCAPDANHLAAELA